MQFHDHANIFPLLSDAELSDLAADIKKHGLLSPIVILDGKILDGRNRFRACQLAEIDPIFDEYVGIDPLGFVISHNLHRRHLDTAQRASVSNKLARLMAHRPSEKTSGIPLVTQEEAAKLLNVSVDSVKQARKVERDGAPELAEAVMQGGISLASAVELTKLPQAEQREVVAAGPEAVKAKAKEIRGSGKPATPTPEQSKANRFTYRPDEAKDIVVLIRIQLERIHAKDVNFIEVLSEVIQICQDRIKEKQKKPKEGKYVPNHGMQCWGTAKIHLDRIYANDKERVEALNACIAYCRARLNSGK